MNLTDEQQKDLQVAVGTVLKALLASLESENLATEAEFEKAIGESLETAYGEFLDPPVDPEMVKEVATRMAKLAKARSR
jgi:hypothetical protein